MQKEFILCTPSLLSSLSSSDSKSDDALNTSVETRPVHIPEYLPPFPDLHTYKFTAVFPENTQDPATRQKTLIKQKRQVESALVKLDRAARLGVPGDNLDSDSSAVEPQPSTSAASNPFLSASVPVVEQAPSDSSEVSHVSVALTLS
jgi:hypothetical protein